MISSIEVTREWLMDNPSPFNGLLDGYEGPHGEITIALDPSQADCFIRNSTRVVIDGPTEIVRYMTTLLMLKVYGVA